ncbi:MAG: methyltransferase domain-containing protein [Pseudonocardiaceae bacterium]
MPATYTGTRNTRPADLFALPFADAASDHLFVCFVLEHLPDPQRALAGLRRVLRRRGGGPLP